jgi:alanyl-tRNA synthetase
MKRYESELGKLRRAEVKGLVDELAASAVDVAGARLVSRVHDAEADDLRELAQSIVGKLESEGGAAVVLGSTAGGKALVVAACSKSLVARGVSAPLLLEHAAKAIGGGAGGKPILGFAGGRDATAVRGALGAIPARLSELLAGG